MNTVKINNPVQDHFSMVPNSLWAMPVSCTAKAIFAFLLSVKNHATVRVALIESTLKIGREKRRAAMRELEEHGLIEREITRLKGRIITDCLVVTTEPLLHALVPTGTAKRRPPENPSPGNRPPEKPSVGFSGPLGAETRRNRGGKPVPLNNTNIKTNPAGLNLNDLGRYAMSCLKAGNPLPLSNGKTLHPSTQEYSQLAELLRKERGADTCTRQNRKGGAS